VLLASTFHKQCHGRGGSWLKSVDLSLQLELPSTCASPHKIVQPCFAGIHHTPWVLRWDIHLDGGSLSYNILLRQKIYMVFRFEMPNVTLWLAIGPTSALSTPGC
jgi:hypothetical protein